MLVRHMARLPKLLGAAGLALSLAGCAASTPPGSAASSGPPAASPSPSPSSSADAVVVSTWQGYLAAFTQMLNTAAPVGSWDRYAALAAASAGTAEMGDYRTHGMVVPGAPTVTDVTVTSVQSDANPPTAALSVCWDTTDFQPVFASSSAPAATGAAGPHLATVGLQQFSQYVDASTGDSGWRVVTFAVTSAPCAG